MKRAKLKHRRSKIRLELLDIESLEAEAPQRAVRKYEIKGSLKALDCDLLVVGGGLGGVAAALSACSSGLKVCLSEETSWLGGQLSSQGVSALDENKYVEKSGATASYQALRKAIRQHYHDLGARPGKARFEPELDPGNCWVSRLAFEPETAVKIIDSLLEEYCTKGKLKIFRRSAAIACRLEGKKVKQVRIVDLDNGKMSEFACRFLIDATELGDLLPLLSLDYATGAESVLETGETHASKIADPENVQDFTYPFVLEFRPGEKHVSNKPASYESFKAKGKFSLLNYSMFEEKTLKNEEGVAYTLLPFWQYRRLIAAENFPPSVFAFDLSMINWESNDLSGMNIIDKSPCQMAARLALAKELSFGFLHWLQNEAPRDEGGQGYSEFKLRPEIMGTADGVSKYPYIRESRRIKSIKTIKESDICEAANPFPRAKLLSDSIGIGHYPIDIHGQKEPGTAQGCRLFQIPLSALIQQELDNFLPACKNIGTTHITNGAYRLHPIEWAIGEAAGLLCAELLLRKQNPQRFYKCKNFVDILQEKLLKRGIPIFWFSDLAPEDPGFMQIQYLTVKSLLYFDKESLESRSQEPISLQELAYSLSRLLKLQPGLNLQLESKESLFKKALAACLKSAYLSQAECRSPESKVSKQMLESLSRKLGFYKDLKDLIPDSAEIKRRDFAVWLFQLHKSLKKRKHYPL